MNRYEIHYSYKRYHEWYCGVYVANTKLFMNDVTIKILKEEIEGTEVFVPIIILEINY